MDKGPGLYSDIGKRARDRLFMLSHSQSEQKFTISTYSPTGAEGYLFLADVNTQLKHKKITTDLNVDTNSNLVTTITVDEPCPGLKTIFTFKAPHPSSAKVINHISASLLHLLSLSLSNFLSHPTFQYLHHYAGISSSVSLAPNPILNFSAALGNNTLAVGSDIAFDIEGGAFTKYDVGASFTTPYLIAALTLNDKFDTWRASYYHVVGPRIRSGVGAEVAHRLSSGESTVTVGAQWALNRVTTATARVNNFGKAGVAMRHELSGVSVVTVSAEVDASRIGEGTKFGLALALKQ